MIAKVCARGRSASGLLRYLTGDSKPDHVALDDADARRLDAPSSQRPDIERPIWHAALSLPDGERLDADSWRAVAADFIERLGLGDHEWTAVVHRETEHEHCHVVANRVGYDGQVWAGEWDGKRAIEAAKHIEALHELTVEPHTPTGCAALSQGEIEQALRTEIQPARTTLQQLIDGAAADRCATAVFLERLEACGVKVLPNVASTGRVSGLAFEYNGSTFKGSQLGKSYGWSQLQKRIEYEQERDGAALQERARGGGRGHEEGPGISGRDSSRARGASTLDARNHESNVQRDERYSAERKNGEREREELGKNAGINGGKTAGNDSCLGIHSESDGETISKPVSNLARSRGPVGGSRQRISALASALLARIEPVELGRENVRTRENLSSFRER